MNFYKNKLEALKKKTQHKIQFYRSMIQKENLIILDKVKKFWRFPTNRKSKIFATQNLVQLVQAYSIAIHLVNRQKGNGSRTLGYFYKFKGIAF